MRKPTLTLIESLISNSNEYVETRLNLFRLKMVQKVTDITSSVVSGIALVMVFFLFFIVVNIGFALLIGDLLGKAYLGFFILAALYIFIGIILFKSRNKWLKTPITNLIIRKFIKNDVWHK